MKKPNVLGIQINQPCHEDWNKMNPTKNGRHCESCSKIVVDFSNMTDAEIILVLSQKSTTCGRFKPEQLQRPLLAEKSHNSKSRWHILAAASLGAMLSIEPMYGMIYHQNPRFTSSIGQQSYRFVYPEYTEFSGVVIDAESGTPLSNATITIFAIGETINVNADGTFYLKLRTKDYRTNEHVLIQSPEFESLELNLSSLFQNSEIKLTKSDVTQVKDLSEQRVTYLKVEMETDVTEISSCMVMGGIGPSWSGGQNSRSSASDPDFLGQAWEAIEDLFSRKKAR
jgi:hypothetical protein